MQSAVSWYRKGTDNGKGVALGGTTMFIYGIAVDSTRGFEVYSGSKLLATFGTYAEARAFADAKGGRWIRYWGIK